MAQWGKENPGEGNRGAISGTISNLGSIITTIDNVSSASSAAETSVSYSDWTGRASSTWRNSARYAVQSLVPVREVYVGAKAAIETYLSTIDGIRDRAVGWNADLVLANAKLSALQSRPFWEVEDIVEDFNKRHRAVEAQSDASEQLEALCRQREEADSTLGGALNRILPTTWPDQKAAFTAIGLTDAASLTPAKINDRMLELANDVRNGRPVNQGAVDGLNEMLEIYGDDEAMMSNFFQELGGEGAARVIDHLGSSVAAVGGNDDFLEAAQKLRSGLAIGTANWTPDQALKFSNGLLYGTPDGAEDLTKGQINESLVARKEAVAFLFSDAKNTTMGRELTITVATEIDDLERNGHGPLVNYNDLGNSGASRLSALENPGSEWRIDNLSGGAQAVDPVTGEGLSVNDLSGRVLESLGQYPDAAMDFLTDSSMGSGERTIGAERLAYWYGERDFSGADQFEGPAALWLGAQQIDGGPFDVEQGPYAMDRAAMLTSDIMFTLATNDNYRAQNLSEDASGMLATNVAVHLDGFTEFLYDHDAVQSDRAGSEPVPIFGTDENRATPKINLDVFLNVIGPIGANDQGSTVLETAATANQARYIDLAIDRPDLLEGALRRINALQGAVDGSATGSTIKSATDHDAIVEEQAEAAALLVSLLPLPPLLPEGKVVLEVTQDVVDFAISQGIDVGMDELKNAALTLDATIADMDLKRDEQNLMMEVRNGQLMYLVYSQQYAAGVEGAPDMSDVAELPIQKENEDKEDYVQRASRWYYDNMDKYTPEGLFANYNAAYGNSKDTTTRDDD